MFQTSYKQIRGSIFHWIILISLAVSYPKIMECIEVCYYSSFLFVMPHILLHIPSAFPYPPFFLRSRIIKYDF